MFNGKNFELHRHGTDDVLKWTTPTKSRPDPNRARPYVVSDPARPGRALSGMVGQDRASVLGSAEIMEHYGNQLQGLN